MSLPISIGDILALVEIAKNVYDKVKGIQEKVDKAANEVIKLEGYLRNLREILTRHKGLGQNSLQNDQVADMKNMLDVIYAHVAKVTQLLKDYRDRRGPLGSTFAVDVAHRVYFATGGGAKKLDELSEQLEVLVREVDRWTTQLNTAIAQQILVQMNDMALGKQKPAPSPAQKRQVSILFIDKDNTGRSKVAEAYAKLVNQWTSTSRDKWPVKTVHSVGLNIKRRNQCLDHLEKLDIGVRGDGNEAPVEHAMTALFDNKMFDFPYKATIRTQTESSRSRGPELSLFKDYDYILIFTRFMDTNLVRLRQQLIKEGGQSVAPKGKGQIKLLGEYGNAKQAAIYHPNKLPDPKEDIEKWKKTVSVIKIAYKNFLKQELGWKQPEPKSAGGK
ncbi:hypothetical protein C1H76_5262 [Elsinoe australis]|uniref:Uncharacterized protein n=1 Tax=Elsinoe australis TaxID=40998 RepID=A0A4U7B0H6_9PEZI|nr:hypothetical protein C1H76_5262 [Elsinoe australis]